ncbi:MAG TPA: MauE/DoxX family redox-associated membrane protein [Candidatus Acidoferrales bacterium]|nr:MauE/DoxX family redox-associated membrane protein [Candidatus Acidoferrales bacterium]
MSNDTRRRLGRIVVIVARVALAAIFLFAAYAKMKPQPGMPWTPGSVRTSLSMFAIGVDSYEMLPPWAVSPFAHFLPPFELFLGLWLLSGYGMRFSGLVSTALICAFILAMYSAYRRGLTISCGCFGQGAQIGIMELIRDGLLFLPLALIVTIGGFVTKRNRTGSTLPQSSASVSHAD